ncbi:hypothetical protein DE146DRAFT_153021 [Phaeosphaeria sp. MPI-PUGE-AT-0046c]|nr:hypothetical protein DE146DRAFT_153021 [Phaeosphaeria sp. MPI-PUGE-AT-0046c]
MATKLLRTASQRFHTSRNAQTSMSTIEASSWHLRSLHSYNIPPSRPASYSTQPHTSSQPSTKANTPSPSLTDPSLPSFNLFHLLRNVRPAVRYTVYFGLGLMATVETTFWFHVLKAKFFPAKEEGQRAKAAEFLERVSDAVKGVRGAWMGNYRRYYEGYVWGVGER